MLPENWVVKIKTQEEWDQVIERLDWVHIISSEDFSIDEGEKWQGIDHLMEFANQCYYEDGIRFYEFTIVTFKKFMSEYIPVPKEERWVVACKTQEEWDAVLERIDSDVESSMFDFNDYEDWKGYGVDSDGEHCDIKDYISGYPKYRIISAYEFLSTGLIRNNYSIF